MKKLILIIGFCFFIIQNLYGTTLVLQPDENNALDAMVNSQNPSQNFGTNSMLIQDWASGYTRGLLQFDLSSIAGSTIISAVLELYNYQPNGGISYEIRQITEAWEEMVVTWNNQPAFSSTIECTVLIPGQGWYSFPITSLVQSWVSSSSTNYGLIVKASVEPPPSLAEPWIYSSATSLSVNRPKLTIEYTNTGVTPSSLGNIKAVFHRLD